MAVENSRKGKRDALADAKRASQRRARRIRLAAWGGAIVVLAGAGTGIGLAVSGGGGGTGNTAGTAVSYLPLSTLGTLRPAPAPGPLGPEKAPVPAAPPLASAASAATGQTVSGINCESSEQTLFHIHTHLTIFVTGQPRQVPGGIGVPGAVTRQTPTGPFVTGGSCFYWLHTHTADGIIHIESPVRRTFTLGDFFAEWRQPLGPDQAGPAKGKVTVIVNGKAVKGNPRDVPLGARENVQLEVGTPLVAPEKMNWAGTGL